MIKFVERIIPSKLNIAQISLLAVFILPLVVLFLVELISFGSIGTTLKWLSSKFYLFIGNYLILVSLFTCFLFINRYVYLIIGFISTSFMLLCAAISNIKNEIRGEPLYPWDYLLINEAFGIVKGGDIIPVTFSIVIVAVICLILLTFYYLFKTAKNFNRKVVRNILFISLGSSVIYIIIFSIFMSDDLKKFVVNYDQTGIAYGFYNNTKSFVKYKTQMSDYSEGTILDIVNEVKSNSITNSETIKPNVIVVMSEAFWDTNKLEGITLNKDPLPYFHELQQNATSGELLVPSYGGGTANTEFEVLTGMSTELLLPGLIAYTSHVNKPIESLASIYREHGYQSVAVHSYHSWYYNRSNVYRYLGFNKFIGMEYFSDAEKISAWIDDHDLMDIVLQEVDSSETPSFIFAVTMLNHGKYPKDRFDEYSFTVDGNMSQEANEYLRTYVETQNIVDSSLKHLITELEKREEPTIVVYFGDHLPLLGNKYQVYKESGFLSGSMKIFEEYKKMYSVPVVIWDNYDNKKNEDIYLSSNLLGGYILEYSGITGNHLFNFNSELLRKEINLIPKSSFYNKVGINSEEKLELINKLSLLQYDILFGESYSSNTSNVIAPDYMLGQSEMKIMSTYPESINKQEPFNVHNGESSLGVYGENFVVANPNFISGSHIYINGEKQPTAYGGTDFLSTSVPSKFYEEKGVLEIQVKVVDSNENVLSSSNIVTITVN